MATDGVKIIDGDCAHDTYWGIMDLYDNGVDFATIENEFPLVQAEYVDEFDNEIYVTACGLAYWEIGQMTAARLDYIMKVIEKGAGVKEWSEYSIQSGRARQHELDRYCKKIMQPNLKIRKRKKYRKITNFHFPTDSILAFKLSDGNFRAVICASISQYRGQCNYILVPTTYCSPKKPTADDLKNENILGTKIGSGYDRQTTKQLQTGIERIWEYVGADCNFFFGLVQLAVTHNDFMNFKDKFEVVGNLKIFDGLKHTGSFGYESDFERFEEIFIALDNHAKIFRYEKFPIKVVCDFA